VIYLDYNATTPVLPEVYEAMRPFFCEEWGNPSSAYRFGSNLTSRVVKAHEQVADLISASPEEILFTSCATESNNSAIRAALKSNPKKRHIVTSAVEHSSVLNHCRALEKEGYRVTYLPVDQDGLLNTVELEDALSDQTVVVSLMWANNETGVIFPVEKIAEICRARDVLFHCDAVQAVGKILVCVSRVPADYLTVSAHKIYGPKGVGVLFIRNGAPFEPMLMGGHQEAGRRGGTENVSFIVGLGLAAEVADRDLDTRAAHVKMLRDKLESELLSGVTGAFVNGSRINRVPHTTNVGFEGVDSDALVAFLDSQGVCVSSGSACLSNALAPSHVVLAMTQSLEKAKQAIRFSLSHLSTDAEITKAIEQTKRGVTLLRS
jgi:cysteine desulfurase